MGRTQDERKADTRERLLAAAADLFARRGVDAVSIDAIADAADRTSGSVYAHFGGKRALLLAVLDRWSGQTARAIAADFAAARTVGARLAATWTNFAAQRDAVTLLHELWLQASRDPEVNEALAVRYADSRRVMAQAYDEWAKEEGVHLPLASDVMATHVFALLLGLDMQRRLDPSAVPDEVALAGFEVLFGLTHDPKEPSHAHASV
jgi:AcrR family transcriptional regulator